MLSNLILLTCLNRYLLVLCYTIVTFSLNRLTASTSQVESQRSKVKGRKLRLSESKNNAVTEPVESLCKPSAESSLLELSRGVAKDI